MVVTNFTFILHNYSQRWLADDFQKERQRHIANAKKLTKAVDTFHKTKDSRKLKKSKVNDTTPGPANVNLCYFGILLRTG